MIPTQFAWLTAIFGTITMLWGQLRGVFLRFSSLFIVTCEIEGNYMNEAVMGYLWANFRRTPFGPRRFQAMDRWIRPLNRYGLVGFEMTSRALTFFHGWKPIFVTGLQNNNNENHLNGNVRISFFRRTFDLDSLIVKAIEAQDQHKISNQTTSNRYTVVKFFGRNGIAKDKGQGESPQAISGKDMANSDNAMVPIRWKRDDLGAPISKSPFSNLAYSAHVQEFIHEIDRWKESEPWYRDRGLNWRFGAGLFGPPGTGKTSFVRAIAQKLDMPIHVYDLTTMSNEELSQFWRQSLNCTPCVVLFEDVDRLFDEKRNIKTNTRGSPLTLDALLNCISGVEPSDGILVMVTANHPDRLDPALGVPDGTGKSTRPGRLDRAVYFGELNEAGRRQIAHRILSDCMHLVEKTVAEGDGESGAQFENRCARIALAEFWGKPKVYAAVKAPEQTM